VTLSFPLAGIDSYNRTFVTSRVSHYLVDAEIGRGGMGVVYSAHDTRLGRVVAIKMPPPETAADPDRHRRFIQDARAASALNHPHIVTIYEIDEDQGTTFIAMDLVDGTPLDSLIAAGGCRFRLQLSSSPRQGTETRGEAV